MRGFETWRPPLWPQTQAELKIMEKNINKDKVQPAACAHQGSARPVKNNTTTPARKKTLRGLVRATNARHLSN